MNILPVIPAEIYVNRQSPVAPAAISLPVAKGGIPPWIIPTFPNENVLGGVELLSSSDRRHSAGIMPPSMIYPIDHGLEFDENTPRIF